MHNLSKTLIDFIQENVPLNQVYQTPIDSLLFFTTSHPQEKINVLYEPSLCVILQGRKEVSLGEQTYEYNPQTYLLSSMYIPAKISIPKPFPQTAFVSLKITFSSEQIYEAWKDIDSGEITPRREPQKGLFFGKVHFDLLEAISRLVQLLNKPKRHRKLLAPLVLKEILYLLFCSEAGEFLKQYTLEGSTTSQITKAILEIRDDLTKPLKIKELARKVAMSESSLHHHFKKITALSPLQFQKRLRLQEARQMLRKQNADVCRVAFDVGYKSPSQFSREYKQMFGASPKADTR